MRRANRRGLAVYAVHDAAEPGEALYGDIASRTRVSRFETMPDTTIVCASNGRGYYLCSAEIRDGHADDLSTPDGGREVIISGPYSTRDAASFAASRLERKWRTTPRDEIITDLGW